MLLFLMLQDKDQRSMDIDTAKAMLGLLLGKHWPLFSSFHQFLDVSYNKLICFRELSALIQFLDVRMLWSIIDQ